MIPKTEARLTVYNGFDCAVRVDSSSQLPDSGGVVESLGYSHFKYTPEFNEQIVNVALTFNDSCGSRYAESRTPLYADVTVTKGKV